MTVPDITVPEATSQATLNSPARAGEFFICRLLHRRKPGHDHLACDLDRLPDHIRADIGLPPAPMTRLRHVPPSRWIA